jgi:chitodextrinase
MRFTAQKGPTVAILSLLVALFVSFPAASQGAMRAPAETAATTATTELVAAYSFNAGTGTSLADSSGSGNAGTISGASWTTSGKYGGALTFDGVNDWVTVTGSPSLRPTSKMTVEAWIRPTALGGIWRTVLVKERAGNLDYALYAHDGGPGPSGHANVNNLDRYAPASPIAVNAWTHLATTYDGASLKLYVNGALKTTMALSGPIASSTNPLRIGGNAVWGEWFKGQIDDVRVYNRALSVAEITSDLKTPVAAPVATTPGDAQAPSAPTGLAVSSITQTSTTLSWTGSSDNVGVTGYGRYRNGTLLSSATGTTYTFTGLTCGTNNTLGVDGYDAAGNRSTRSSMTATTSACSPSQDTQPPSAPQGLLITGSTQTSINVSWSASTDNVGVAGYGRYANGSLVGSGAGTSYTFSGLNCNTAYSLGVDGYDAAGNRSARASLSATTGACPPPPPPPPGSGTANLWLDPSGGSCVRFASPVGYVDAQACGSLQAAANAAVSGDTINIADGSYPGQSVSGTKTLTFRAAGPGRPSFGQFVSAASNLTVRGVLVQNRDEQPTPFCSTWILDYTLFVCAPNNTYDNVIVDGMRHPSPDPDRRGGIQLTGSGSGFVFKNGEIRGVWDSKGFQGGADNMVFENNLWNDIRLTNAGGAAGVHNECAYVAAGDNQIWRGNTFLFCPIMAMFFANFIGGPPFSNVLIENNIFTHAVNDENLNWHDGAAFVIPNGQSGQNQVNNWVVRYNTFEVPPSIERTPGTGDDNGSAKFYGNLGAAGSCGIPEWTYSYNVGQVCGGTGDLTVANATNNRSNPNRSPFYINAPAGDFHLKPGSAPINRGDPSRYPPTDRDNLSRPIGSAPDAGAHEWR